MLTNQDYRIVLTAYLNGDTTNPIQNQFWYKADSPAGTAQELSIAFHANVIPAIASVVVTELNFVQAEVINLVDLQDFTILATGIPGERAGGYQNRWDAWAIQYLRPVRGMNNGSKRLGPISRSDYTGQVMDVDLGVTMDLVTDALESVLSSLGGTAYAPCCVKTVKVPNENGNGKFHYEPDTLYICNSVSYQRVSHQESRD